MPKVMIIHLESWKEDLPLAKHPVTPHSNRNPKFWSSAWGGGQIIHDLKQEG